MAFMNALNYVDIGALYYKLIKRGAGTRQNVKVNI